MAALSPALEQLAALLRRPASSLEGLAALSAQQLAELDQAIAAACARQRQETQTALKRALPQPLRALVLAGVRAEEP